MDDHEKHSGSGAAARTQEDGEREGENVREGVDHVQHDEERQLRPVDGPEDTNRAQGGTG
ncbi:MAG TPA: hypothetical protein VM536_18390 [Chloroflexia bacterium]|nr:hypothetical protein [Chloroflexia bacterium]